MECPLGALLARFADPRLDEILVNGTRGMFLESRSGRMGESSPFDSVSVMIRWIQHLALSSGIRLDPLEPAAGGSLEDGRYRWHAVLPPVAGDGPVFSIRRHRLDHLVPGDFAASNEDRESLEQALSNHRSLLFCGPTGSGKTSLMVALLRQYAWQDRVVILEDVAEIPAASPSWVRMCARRPNVEGMGGIPLARLLAESLRLRPERLVVGEIRGGEAAAFLQALVTGHDGGMATLHAGSVDEVIERLEFLSNGVIRDAGKLFRRLLDEGRLVCVFMDRGDPPRYRVHSSPGTNHADGALRLGQASSGVPA